MRFEKRDDGSFLLNGEGDMCFNFRQHEGGPAMYIGDKFLPDGSLVSNWHLVGVNPKTMKGIAVSLLVKLALWVSRLGTVQGSGVITH